MWSHLWPLLVCKIPQFLAKSYRCRQLITLFQKVDTLRLLKIYKMFCLPAGAKYPFFQAPAHELIPGIRSQTPYTLISVFDSVSARISKSFFHLFGTSCLAKIFFIDAGFRSFNVSKVSRAKVLSLLTYIANILQFLSKVLQSLS